MVRFAVSSMFFYGYPLEEVFAYIGQAGFDATEFWMETPHFWIRNCPVPELHACLRMYPALALTLHAPVLDLNACSINPRVAEISRQYAVEALDLAEHIGAEVVTLHPGKRTVKRVPGRQEYERFELYLDSIRSAARTKHVTVSMENMEPAVNALLCTPESMKELLDQEPWLHFTLDTSHALATSKEEVYRYLDLCGDRLVNVHLSRTENRKMHLPLYGYNEGREIIRALKEHGYGGHLTLEIEDRNFLHDLSIEERIALLMREIAYVRESWD